MLKINFNPFPELHTSRLVLRQITLDDAHDLHKLRSNKQVLRYLDRDPDTLEQVKYFIQTIANALVNNQSIMWGLAFKQDNRLVGAICYWQLLPEHHRAEIGYMLHPDFQGKGLMHEALTRVITYGFEGMKLHSIAANVNPANAASIKVLEKTNFVREGYFRESYYSKGKFSDSAIYSLVNGLK